MGTDEKTTGTLAAFDGTGKLLWSDGLLAPDHGTPAIAPGDEYVADTAGDVYAFGPAGKQLWQTIPFGAPIESSLAVANGVLYGTAETTGIVICCGFALDATNGAALWDHDCGGSTSSPAVLNGAFVMADSTGLIIRFGISS